ncbi:MAG TPA: nuclear transport factor 2 family protein [Longimicrobiaceae bacterium]|jgi:regulator of protease activity HflC (stomatin/prohibitin superfamily)
MKTAILALAASLAVAAAPSYARSPRAADEAGVRAALQHYLDGHATGRAEHFAAAMHPEMRMFWIRDGALSQRTQAEYVAGASGRPAADEAQRRRWIEEVDVTGDAAVAKVVLDYPQARITDYMSLLRVDGEWRIVNKTFHSQPKGGS